MVTKKDLINFEKEVIEKYKEGNTYGPVHLSGGNEDALIKIFKKIKPQDWIFTNHRSHYHALLKSKNKRWLMKEIIKKANSSHINSKKYKIFSSAIVGGNIPIALGVALGIRGVRGKERVYCFVGDMASQMGAFIEAHNYAYNFDLPITFIVENNNLGCDTPTSAVWGKQIFFHSNKIINYTYKRKYPHYGIGEWVTLKNEMKTKGDYNAIK